MLVEDDLYGSGSEPIAYIGQVIEALLVRGLTSDRASNGSPKDYHLWNDNEDMVLSEGINDLHTKECSAR